MSKATTTPLSLAAIVILVVASVFAQNPASQRTGNSSASAPRITPQATSQPVVGVGTPGRLAKWAGLTATTSTIADSNISEDKFGNLGIGTDPTGSLLTVGGIVQTTVGFKFADGTLMTTAGLSAVTHDTSLSGIGTAASPLGLATGGVNTLHLGNGAVTAAKIASGQVVKSFNGLFDNVTLAAGTNITITPSGNTLTIASTGLTSVAHNATLTGMGTAASPLSVVSDEALIEPIALNVDLITSIDPGSIYTVPTGKRLVIEHVSARCNALSGRHFTVVSLVTQVPGIAPARYHLIPVFTSTFGPLDVFVVSQTIRAYANPNADVHVFAQTNGDTGECDISLTGHLVTLP